MVARIKVKPRKLTKPIEPIEWDVKVTFKDKRKWVETKSIEWDLSGGIFDEKSIREQIRKLTWIK